jgi:hypothetical protein
MKKEEYENKWVLLDKNNKVIYFSDNIGDVVRKGKKYPVDEVSIEKKIEHGICFF